MEQFKKIIEKIKERITKMESKKIVERAVIVAIIGAIVLIAGSVFFEKDDKAPSKQDIGIQNAPESVQAMKQSEDEPKKELETSLKNILSKIQGAGKVEVMITFFSGNEAVPAIDVKTNENDTQEKDKEGGSRSIKQTDKENKVIYEENDGIKKPFIVKEILPQVKGVVIVAEGARDAEIKMNLAIATEALLDIPIHKVQVFEKSKD